MFLIELSAEVEVRLLHMRLKREALGDCLSRIIAEAYEAMLSRGDPRVP